MPDKVFVDTNIWVYLYLHSTNIKDQEKHQQAKNIINKYSEISVSTQVLNELSNVLYRKYKINSESIKHYLHKILSLTEIYYLSEEDSFQALKLIENYNFSFYDALIVNAALNSKCHILLSEDMQHGQLIENNLQIVNPFFNV